VGVLETGAELERQRRDPAPLVIGAIVVLLGAGIALYLYWQSQQAADGGPVLTEEARAYLADLDLGEVQMAASDTFLTQTLVEITGKIENLGSRTVELVEINCVFRDVDGIEIAREPSVIVGPRTGPLGPGQQKSFRLAFDSLPEGWNQNMPNLFVAQILFGDEDSN
jgi:hypothetical protein